MQAQKVILVGIGGVGGELVEQILSNRALHDKQYGLVFQIQAVCDSSGAVICGDGESELSDEQLRALLTYKRDGKRLCDHKDGVSQQDLSSIINQVGSQGTLVVDCSATDATTAALADAISNGAKIVLANKIPLTSQQEVYNRLTQAGATEGYRNLTRTRWETTVGAGLPVIATQTRLVSSGDEISRITGTFSGTLGYVMTGLEEGKLLSEIVRFAYDLGYTEPDPRDDLGGVDVARKALILARGLGWEMEMTDVSVEGLYPPSMDELSVDAFMAALPELDESFQARIDAAKADGKVLRYAAIVENNECRVMPTTVSADSPLGRLSGTDNLVEFTTRWYSPNPLVIQGKGAGTEATAAGVLSDMIELVHSA